MKPISSHRILRLTLPVLIAFLLALALAPSARAVEFRDKGVKAGEVVDDDLFISSDRANIDGTVNGDLFINSTETSINGTVNGNVVAATSFLNVKGQINGSLILFSQSSELEGQISGSVYGLGYSLGLQPGSSVSRNVYYLGYNLNTRPNSTIARDLLFSTYQGLLYGEVKRNVRSEVSALELGGKVGGDVTAKVSGPDEEPLVLSFFMKEPSVTAAQPGLRVREDAQLEGKLTYTSPVDQNNTIRGVPQGGIVFWLSPSTSEKSSAAQLSPQAAILQWTLKLAREFVTLLVLGSLAIWLVPAWLESCAAVLGAHPLPSAGWGLVALVVGFSGSLLLVTLIIMLGILVAVITLGGLSQVIFGVGFSSLGLAFTIFLLLITYGSKIIIAYLTGRLILKRLAPGAAPFGTILLGVLLYTLVHSIPILGSIVNILATLLGLGAIWLAIRANNLKSDQLSPQPA